MQRQFTSEDDVIENLDGDIAGAALTLHISTDHLEYYWSHSIMYSCECSSLTDASGEGGGEGSEEGSGLTEHGGDVGVPLLRVCRRTKARAQSSVRKR
jgi:hypothetical protein